MSTQNQRYSTKIIADNLERKVFLNPFVPLLGVSHKDADSLILKLIELYLPKGLRTLGDRAVNAGRALMQALFKYLYHYAPDGRGYVTDDCDSRNSNEQSIFMIMTLLNSEDGTDDSRLKRLFEISEHACLVKEFREFRRMTKFPDLIAHILLQQFKPLFTESSDNIFSDVKNPEIEIPNIARSICYNGGHKLEYILPEDNAEIYLLSSILFLAYYSGGNKRSTFHLSDLPTFDQYCGSIERLKLDAPDELAVVYYYKSLKLDSNVRTNFFELYNKKLVYFAEFGESMRPEPQMIKKRKHRIKIIEASDEYGKVHKFEVLDETVIEEQRYFVLTLLNKSKHRQYSKKEGQIYLYDESDGQIKLKSIQGVAEFIYVKNRFNGI